MTVDIYMQLPGIPGDSVERDHKGWITVTGVTWGVEQSSSGGLGGVGGGGRAGRASQHPLAVSAPTSIASPLIFEAITKGTNLPSARLDIVRSSDARSEVAFRWEFEDARLMQLHIAGAAPGLDDSFELVAKRARVSVFPVDDVGRATQAVARGWDFAAHRAW